MIRPGHAVLMSVLLWSCAGDTRALGDGGIDAPEETGGADAEVSEPVEDGGASDPADTSGADEQDAATDTPGADVSITLDDCHSAAPESPDVGDTSPDAGAVDAADAVIGTVEPLYPTSGADWNRYVANDGADVLSASDTACAPEAAGGYMGCLHGGQMRAVSVPGHDACGELTATDALGAFTWVCDPGANPVRMVSIALREDARLSDLVDLDEVAWRDNAVTVWDGAVPVVVTPPAAWWSNPIVACPCAGLLDLEGAVYLVGDDTPTSHVVAADRIALVVAPGVTLRGPGAGEDVIAAYERAFLWLEGVVDAGGDESGVRWHGVRRSVMRGVDVSGSGWLGVSLWSSHHNQLVDLRVAHNDTGLFLTGSSHNTIHRVTASNNTDVGVHLLNGCEANTLGTVTSFAATEGVRIEGSVDNTLAAVTVANTGGYTGLADGGVHLFAGSDHTLVMSAAVANGSGSGFFLELSNRNTFVDVAAADGGITGGKTAAFRLDDSSHNRFTGVLKAGHKATTKACSASGGDEPGLLPGAAGCANAGDSDATITNDVTTADTFVGKALEDAVNVGGTGLLPASCVSDWAGFENRSRGWGLDGGAFPSVDHIGPCVTGPCRIWDWSLSASDTVLADVNPGLPGGDDVVQHNWSAGSAAECEAMGGDWTGDLCTSVLLRGAVEVLADGVGNDNGLCESRERCLVTPNVGAYQGHEDAQIVGTIGQGAQLSDIVLLRHPVNGM